VPQIWLDAIGPNKKTTPIEDISNCKADGECRPTMSPVKEDTFMSELEAETNKRCEDIAKVYSYMMRELADVRSYAKQEVMSCETAINDLWVEYQRIAAPQAALSMNRSASLVGKSHDSASVPASGTGGAETASTSGSSSSCQTCAKQMSYSGPSAWVEAQSRNVNNLSREATPPPTAGRLWLHVGDLEWNLRMLINEERTSRENLERRLLQVEKGHRLNISWSSSMTPAVDRPQTEGDNARSIMMDLRV